ncbi:MAG: hypothetical protein K2Y08_06060, partial [Alphaproteobacteria bacterium]|nr:hypothetical protein [Alphaproteobacteria bacterium]
TAAGVLKGYQFVKEGDMSLLNDALLIMAFSFFFGFCAIAFMMRWLQRSTLTPFVIYRLLLGVFLLISVYSGFISSVPCH